MATPGSGRWLPCNASEILDPRQGFVWKARVAGRLVVGPARYFNRAGAMRWDLLGVLPIMRASGTDVARSAAGRAGGESLWVPTAVLPRFGGSWESDADGSATVRFAVDETPLEIHYDFGADGHIRRGVFRRWGDPDRTGTWEWHRCGVEVAEHRRFCSLTIPSVGSIGWHRGTDRMEERGVLPVRGHRARTAGGPGPRCAHMTRAHSATVARRRCCRSAPSSQSIPLALSCSTPLLCVGGYRPIDSTAGHCSQQPLDGKGQVMKHLKRTVAVIGIVAFSALGLLSTAGTANAEGECWHWVDSVNWEYFYDWNTSQYYYDYGAGYCETPSEYQARSIQNQANLLESLRQLGAVSGSYNPATGYDPSTGNIQYQTGFFDPAFGSVLGPSVPWTQW